MVCRLSVIKIMYREIKLYCIFKKIYFYIQVFVNDNLFTGVTWNTYKETSQRKDEAFQFALICC